MIFVIRFHLLFYKILMRHREKLSDEDDVLPSGQEAVGRSKKNGDADDKVC